MAQEYEIVAFEATDFQDNHGNYWCNIVLKGAGEPLKIVVKDPTKYEVGQKIYGNITDETSKAGKPYRRFRRESQQDAPKSAQDEAYWEERNKGIKAQFAIKAAVALLRNPEGEVEEDTILHWARIFFNMVEKVDQPEQSGYEQSKAKAEDLRPDAEYDEPINLEDIPF